MELFCTLFSFFAEMYSIQVIETIFDVTDAVAETGYSMVNRVPCLMELTLELLKPHIVLELFSPLKICNVREEFQIIYADTSPSRRGA